MQRRPSRMLVRHRPCLKLHAEIDERLDRRRVAVASRHHQRRQASPRRGFLARAGLDQLFHYFRMSLGRSHMQTGLALGIEHVNACP